MTEKPWNILMVVLSTVAPDVRVEKEARFLAKAGHNVTVIGTNPKGDLPAEEKRDGYTIQRVIITKKIIFKYFEFWKKVKQLVGEKKYDIVHLHDLNVLPLVSRLATNTKISIYDSHENFPEQMSETFGFLALWVYTWMERKYIKQVQGVLTPGETYSDNLQRKYKVKSSWVSNYPSKEDVENAHRMKIQDEYEKDEKFRVVHFGVMYSNLGYDKTVEAAKILKEKLKPFELEFLVMGSGAAYEPMKELIKREQLGDYFKLTGWMNYIDALSIMRTCDVGLVLFQPGKNNYLRMPNRLFEYCSAGVPFIGSDFEGLQKATRDAKGLGILIDPTSPQAIADAIYQLYKDKEQLQKMKELAKTKYSNIYNWEIEAQKLIEIYKNALKD
ncbi:MAG: glycosyltransferase family 4 protein [Candidatus Heimdallarchaeaceae archaeon]|jgi:glycosyltransferase involved in cell wall biosynthesis